MSQGIRGKGRGQVEPQETDGQRSGPWARTKAAKCVLELVEELYEILIHDYYLLRSSILFVLSWELKIMVNVRVGRGR
jgi:hypothetical protein